MLVILHLSDKIHYVNYQQEECHIYESKRHTNATQSEKSIEGGSTPGGRGAIRSARVSLRDPCTNSTTIPKIFCNF